TRNIGEGHDLKLVLQPKLHHPPVVRHTRTLAAGSDPAERVGRLDAQPRRAEIYVVEEVKEFRAELKIIPLTDPKVLEGRGIHLVQTRQMDRLARGIAEHAQRRLCEGRRIEPLIPRPLTAGQFGLLSGHYAGSRADSGARGIAHAG